jgi:hypothetical protein
MTDPADPLAAVEARWESKHPPLSPQIDWLIGEVERLRRIVNKPLGEIEAETRERWFGETDLCEVNRSLRAELEDRRRAEQAAIGDLPSSADLDAKDHHGHPER